MVNAEPNKCAKVEWVPVDVLPSNTVPYTAAGVESCRMGTGISVHILTAATSTADSSGTGTRRRGARTSA